MKTIAIEAHRRERTGKGSARSARREGRIPGVLYGRGENVVLSVDRKRFARALNEAGDENVIFDVMLPGQEPLKAIAREIQIDPITRGAIHVDFQHIDMSKKIHLSVAVHLVGEPEGVKNYGGILEQPMRQVEVVCLPANIPSHIDVDVSKLMIGDSVHVSDIVPEGFEFLDEPSKVIAQVAAPTVARVEEEEEAAAAEEAVEGEAPPEGEAAEKPEEGPEGDGGQS
jgi:large subunit ribosomal protein L25